MGTIGQNCKMNLHKKIKDKIREISINSLSDDCLAKLFMYLPIIDRLNIEQVCIRWEAVSEFSWYDVKKFNCHSDSEEQEYLSQAIVESILHRCGFYLTTLSLPQNLDSNIMKIVTENCPNLTTINITLKNIDIKYFINAFSSMKNLKNISVETSQLASNSHLGLLENLPEKMEKIELSCSSMPPMSSKYYLSSFEKFTSLHSLALHNLSLTSSTMEEISRLTSLINLTISFCSIETLFSFSSFDNLETLKIDRILPELFPNDLVNNCEKLKNLTLDRCINVPAEALQGISRLKSMENLKINQTSNVNDSLFNYFDKLKALDCSNCPEISDIGIIKILNNCKTLEMLDVSDTGVTIETIFHAIELTKSRFNNITLKLTASKKIVDEYNDDEREKNESQLLIIIEKDDRFYYGINYGEPDDVNMDDWFDGIDDVDGGDYESDDVAWDDEDNYDEDLDEVGWDDGGLDEVEWINNEIDEGVWNDDENGEEVDEGALEDEENGEEVDEGAWGDEESGEEVDEGAWDDGENGEEVDEGAWDDEENGEEVDEAAWYDGENEEEIDEGTWDDNPNEIHEDNSPDFDDIFDQPDANEEEEECFDVGHNGDDDVELDFDDNHDDNDAIDFIDSYDPNEDDDGQYCYSDFDDGNQDDDFGVY